MFKTVQTQTQQLECILDTRSDTQNVSPYMYLDTTTLIIIRNMSRNWMIITSLN